jgi:hypothetical protein
VPCPICLISGPLLVLLVSTYIFSCFVPSVMSIWCHEKYLTYVTVVSSAGLWEFFLRLHTILVSPTQTKQINRQKDQTYIHRNPRVLALNPWKEFFYLT